MLEFHEHLEQQHKHNKLDNKIAIDAKIVIR